MPTSYEMRGLLANATSFRAQAQMAAIKTANDIYAAEAPLVGSQDAPPTEEEKYYRQRVFLATSVMQSPSSQVERFVWFALADEPIADAGLAAEDAAFYSLFYNGWDQLAGVVTKPAGTP